MTGANVLYRQIEASECGLACLAMCSSLLGAKVDMVALRQQFPISARGATLADLVAVAGEMGLAARALRCEPQDLSQLARPAVLHWRLDHFIVLTKVTRRGVEAFDPSVGQTVFTHREVAELFSGVALEVQPTAAFQKRRTVSPLPISSLLRWTAPIRATLAQAVLLSLILQAYVIASPLYMQLAIDEAALKGDVGLLNALAAGFGLLALFNAVAEALRAVALQRVSSLLSWDMTQRLYHHMVRLPLPWFQRRRLADTFSRFQSLDPLKTLVANGLVAAVMDGVLSIVTLVMMFLFARVLAVITLLSFGIYIGVRLLGIPFTRRLAANVLQATIAEQGKRLETLRTIQSIKVMGAEARREMDWANRFAEVVKTTQASALAGIGFASVQKLFDAIAMVVVVFLGVRDVIKGDLTIGVFYAFVAYRTQFMGRTISLFEQIVNWRMLDIYTYRLADVVLTAPENHIDRTPPGLPAMTGRMTLKNVAFQYGPTDPFIFRGVNLTVEPGEFLAIAGPSGGGKSTLLKVLCGLYPPTHGEIGIDGLPLATWGPKSVRAHLGAVMQDDELMAGSIAENVSFFDEACDIDWVWECLRTASVADEVQAMPMRAETLIGDLGVALSGGQKQRVLLARALYKRPRLLVLDEATSHLDLWREGLVTEALRQLNLTRIVVAHRPQTLKIADRVLMLDRGGLVEPRSAQAPSRSPTDA